MGPLLAPLRVRLKACYIHRISARYPLATEAALAHRGMNFGIFLAPFHKVGENPTLAMNRDMELIEWMDYLGYDEVWIGEHHSAGWELIASPEVFIAAAAERTRHIMLGSGVTSLPYHHPLMVAQRFVQLDHMTRGRAMLGIGPGALVSDAYMMGIEPVTQRARMDESLDAIMQLLRCEEPVTLKTDWFELREARLHLAPYTDPHFPIALVGTPDTVIRGIERLQELSAGGFGGVLFRAHEWANREQTLKSYELFARYVMPRFQGSLGPIRDSNEWARSNRKTIFSPNVEAVPRAFTDAGPAVPVEFPNPTAGARDAGDSKTS